MCTEEKERKAGVYDGDDDDTRALRASATASHLVEK